MGIVGPRNFPVGARLEALVEGGGDGGVATYISAIVVG